MVDFPMAVSTHHDTLVKLGFDTLPSKRLPLARKVKLFCAWVKMMKLKCISATIISAALALIALVSDSHLPHFSTTPCNGTRRTYMPNTILLVTLDTLGKISTTVITDRSHW